MVQKGSSIPFKYCGCRNTLIYPPALLCVSCERIDVFSSHISQKEKGSVLSIGISSNKFAFSVLPIGQRLCGLAEQTVHCFFAVWAYVVSIIVLQDLHVIHLKALAYSTSKVSNPKSNILYVISSLVNRLSNFMCKIEE